MKLVLGRSQEGGTCQIFLQIPDTYVLLLIRLLLAHLHIIRTLNPFFFPSLACFSKLSKLSTPPPIKLRAISLSSFPSLGAGASARISVRRGGTRREKYSKWLDKRLVVR